MAAAQETEVMSGHILAIDQGTTSSRAIVFDPRMNIVSSAQTEITQHFPQTGWVEHDADEIWDTVLSTARDALARSGTAPGAIAAVGITNQRETTVVWERATGRPLHKAIVWQDRRTAEMCDRLKVDGYEKLFTAKTGLLLDPYFSGTKLRWLLDNVEGLRARAEAGEVCFGTIDSWIIYKLTGGRAHVTDATNASRTLIYNIAENDWDDELLEILRIPRALLPEVRDCADDFGTVDPAIFGAAIPILGVAGDQQAATIGNACFEPGMVKSTYGTGCFALLNTGDDLVRSKNRLLTTIAYRLDGRTTYALEGSIFIAGAAVQWLRDGLGIIDKASGGARRDLRPDAQQRPGGTGTCGPRIRRLPDARSSRRHEKRLGRPSDRNGSARRWRHVGFRMDDAAPCQHSLQPRRSRGHARDDGARRSLACRIEGRCLAGTGGVCPRLGARPEL
jgi:glycerol kinase